MQRVAKAIQIFLLICSSSYTYCFANDDLPQGFLWYNEVIEQESIEPTNKKPAKESDQSSSGDAKTVWDKNINQLQQQVEQSQRKALDNPTFENVLAAQKAQREASEKSKAFAAMWKYVALVDSGIAAGNANNSNGLQKKISEQIKSQQTNKDLRSLGKHWALVLEVEDSCPYCHAFAPLVKEFAAKFGFQLLASSRAGTDFAGIQGGRNLGQMIKYNPQHITPVLYLVHENAKEVYPIARGVKTEEEMIENIMSIDKHERRLF